MMQEHIGVKGTWKVRERNRKTGLVVMEREVHNVFTPYGLSLVAGGVMAQPLYLAVENNSSQFYTQAVAGAGQVVLNSAVHLTGDTQLVLSPGQGTQEIVTYTSVSGTGPVTYTLSGTVANTHPITDYVCRNVASTDTNLSIVNEQQYDSVNAPNQRLVIAGGYSPGSGQYTMQWYYPGNTALFTFMICGIMDNQTIGQGSLVNHFVLGYTHSNVANDVEIDGTITLSNI